MPANAAARSNGAELPTPFNGEPQLSKFMTRKSAFDPSVALLQVMVALRPHLGRDRELTPLATDRNRCGAVGRVC